MKTIRRPPGLFWTMFDDVLEELRSGRVDLKQRVEQTGQTEIGTLLNDNQRQ